VFGKEVLVMAISRMLLVAALVGVLAAPGWAAPESSCPAPCTKLPKAALFVAEPNGALSDFGDFAQLTGTLATGKKHTVLRIDAMVSVLTSAITSGCYVQPFVNGIHPAPTEEFITPSTDTPLAVPCSISGIFWLDLDAAEAAHPGVFIGQPLVVVLEGGSLVAGGLGVGYSASMSMQVINNK
jgi:hypothetical protein